jgi:hypothetical protein
MHGARITFTHPALVEQSEDFAAGFEVLGGDPDQLEWSDGGTVAITIPYNDRFPRDRADELLGTFVQSMNLLLQMREAPALLFTVKYDVPIVSGGSDPSGGYIQ